MLKYYIESYYHKAKSIKNRVLKGRKSRLPSAMQVSLSDCCNFRCTTCWLHGPKVLKNEYNLEANLFNLSKPGLMELDIYKNLINDIGNTQIGKGNNRPITIQFCGKGEPTLNPNFQEMMILTGEKGFIKPLLVTNGSRLTMEMLRNLYKTRLHINVSLNASNTDNHKAFSNVKEDYFTPVVELIKEYNTSNYRSLDFSLSFVIGSHNIAQVPDMAKVSGTILLPGNTVSFYPELTHTENKENCISKKQLTELINRLPNIKAVLKESCLSHNLDILPYVLYAFSLSEERNFPTRDYYRHHPCRITDDFLAILADGRVVPCCRSGYVFGNIKQQNIQDIWFSEKASNFRYQANTIYKRKTELLQSHCFSCDHLMGSEYFRIRYLRPALQ